MWGIVGKARRRRVFPSRSLQVSVCAESDPCAGYVVEHVGSCKDQASLVLQRVPASRVTLVTRRCLLVC